MKRIEAWCLSYLHTIAQKASSNDEEGAMSAEYAVATIAAVSFAALLIAVIASPDVRAALTGIISDALSQR